MEDCGQCVAILHMPAWATSGRRLRGLVCKAHTQILCGVMLGGTRTRPVSPRKAEFSLSDSMNLMSRLLPSGRGWPVSCLSPSFLCSPGTSWRRWYAGLC